MAKVQDLILCGIRRMRLSILSLKRRGLSALLLLIAQGAQPNNAPLPNTFL